MKTLKDIFAKIGNHTGIDIGCNDKGGIHTYVDTYDKLFAPFQNGCTFMEIGLAQGDSVDLFDQYFKNSEIIGVDLSIIFEPKKYRNKVELIAADGTKPEFLEKIRGKEFDIVIDDASHMTQDQIITFHMLKGQMKPGSIYVIEDLLALDQERHKYMALHENVEIIDMRSNGRFDNALCVIRF